MGKRKRKLIENFIHSSGVFKKRRRNFFSATCLYIIICYCCVCYSLDKLRENLYFILLYLPLQIHTSHGMAYKFSKKYILQKTMCTQQV